jgi:deoxyribodipyrimidine photolyase
MAVAAPSSLDYTDEQKAIIEMVRQFADEQIIPNAEHYDAADEYPAPIVDHIHRRRIAVARYREASTA